MKWIKTTIGEHCTVTSSKRFHLSERSDKGIPFYCSKEIIQKLNGQEITKCDYIREDFYEDVKRKFGVPRVGDLLITTRGTYGVPYIYKETDRFYFADGNLTWLKDFDDVLFPKYLYYWVLSYEGQKKIDAIAKGTAQKAVPIAAVKLLEINLPLVDTQHKVVEILSAYDSLVENTRKQIKLLEEAAQRLYKEWFMNLRFPGYENTPVVDGVPEGWKKDRADSFFDITIGKTPPRAESQWFTSGNDGIPWTSISDMGNNSAFISETAESLTNDAVQRHNIKVVAKDTIFLSFKLTVGRVAISTRDMCTNEAIAHFHISNALQREYVYCYLKQFPYETLGSTSSISKAVNSQIIKAMPFIMPEESLLKKFNKRTQPIFDMINRKTIQMQKPATVCYQS